MSEIKTIVTRQFWQLQMFMHRASFQGFLDGVHNPHRGQGKILSILKVRPIISQKELTYISNMSKQAVGELVYKLEKSGYITKEPSKKDKRVMMITLTEKGELALGEEGDGRSKTSKVLDCLSDDELVIFNGYLDRILKVYEEEFSDDDFDERKKFMEEFRTNKDLDNSSDEYKIDSLDILEIKKEFIKKAIEENMKNEEK